MWDEIRKEKKVEKKVDKDKILYFNNVSLVNNVTIHKDLSGRIVVTFPYNPSIRTIQ
jgi:hypothetical protein